MTTLPGQAYPVIMSMGTGWRQMGQGRGCWAVGTQLRGQELGFFPQNGVQRPGRLDSWLSNSLALLLPPGSSVLQDAPFPPRPLPSLSF